MTVYLIGVRITARLEGEGGCQGGKFSVQKNMNRKSKNTIEMPTDSVLAPWGVGVSVSTAATMIIQIPMPLVRVSMYEVDFGNTGGTAHNTTHDE